MALLPYGAGKPSYITNETINQGTTFLALGDSITFGTGASTTATDYVNRLALAKNWTVNNQGVSGSKVNDTNVTDYSYAKTAANGDNTTLMIGVNNSQQNGTDLNYLDTFRGNVAAVSAWLTIPDGFKIRASAATKTGTWAVNTGIYGSMDYVSTTNASTMTAIVTGTTAYIGHIRSVGVTGTFTVTIDGVNCGTFNTSGSVPARIVDSATYGAYLLRFPGLKTGPHTIVVTVTSVTSASNPVYIDWFGGNGFEHDINDPCLWLANTTRATSAYYTAHAPFTDAAVSLYNNAVAEVYNDLSTDGLNIMFVDAAHAYIIPTDVAADGLHPADSGHQKLANVFASAMSSIVKPRDRGAMMRQNSAWQDAALLNSWVNYGTPYYNVGYMKDSYGFIHLRGITKSGVISSTIPIFTLPISYRPGQTVHFVVDSNAAHGVVEVDKQGNLVANAGNTLYVAFDGIIFFAG